MAARVVGPNAPEPTTFSFGHVKVDLLYRRVFAHGTEVKLTKLAFDLLKTGVHHAGKVLTHRLRTEDVLV